ncbi:MAG: carboxypeptidase regulatory-like domain-containing protein, partial [Acidobacteria bacterium]|nr:carboxypeptidase regulatory-like domain-containing protein [Acidobacteriota bacterium]
MKIENVKFRAPAVLAVACAFMFLALPAYAQYSSVSGKVLDQAGAVIPGVTVTLTGSTGAVRDSISNEVGVYQFLQVPPGT